MDGEVYPDVQAVSLDVGNRLFLCTDSLTTIVSDERISSILRTNADMQVACQMLVEESNIVGGRDHITLVIVDLESNRAVESNSQGYFKGRTQLDSIPLRGNY
jgi:protein phosphatase